MRGKRRAWNCRRRGEEGEAWGARADRGERASGAGWEAARGGLDGRGRPDMDRMADI